jgi:alkaline phosphatase D
MLAAYLLAVAPPLHGPARLSSGPMVAYAEMTQAAIWVQTNAAAKVAVEYWPAGAGQSAVRSVAAATGRDDIALLTVTGLEFGTRYDYRLRIDGEAVVLGHPAQFQTQPHWRWAKNPPEPPEFTFAVGSCHYVNEPKFDRPGNAYGGDPKIFRPIYDARPAFMVWLGDNVYYREPDWLTEEAMRHRWRHGRAQPELQPLLANAAHYAVWDDHDFGPNDSDRSFRLKDAALRVFDDYFPSLQRGTRETPGCFFRFEWGDVEFFMLDDRFWRSPNSAPMGPDKVMLGKGQLQWLKDALLSSRATFKVVANGGQMVNPMVFYEAFGLFPAEQKELFDFLASAKIEGLVFLSGDRHAGELLKVQWPGAPYPWYEMTTSPLTAGAGRNEREADNPARVPGTWVTRTHHYGLVRVEGPWGDRRLVLAHYDNEGKELWRHTVHHRELRAPR